jgi:predicted RNA-binding protein with PUA-like domain
MPAKRAKRPARGATRSAKASKPARGPARAVAAPSRAAGPAAWLVKSEPTAYAFEELVRDGRTVWDGVRNPQARNHLAAMREGERVLFYHTGEVKAVVGIAVVARAAFPEPGAGDPRWLAVELAPLRALARPVALAEIKADRALRALPLVAQSRLSVMPIASEAFERILAKGGAAGDQAPAARPSRR